MGIGKFLRRLLPWDERPLDHNLNNKFLGIYETQAVVNKIFATKKHFTKELEGYQRLHNNKKITEKQYARGVLLNLARFQQELLFAENQIEHIMKDK